MIVGTTTLVPTELLLGMVALIIAKARSFQNLEEELPVAQGGLGLVEKHE